MELNLPLEVKDLLEKTIFDLEDEVNPNYLNRYLFYMPEVIRIIGLMVVELKRQKRDVDREIYRIENVDLERIKSRVMLEISTAIDSWKYKNEQSRTAKVMDDKDYLSKLEELLQKKKVRDELESDIDRYMEELWKYKNLLGSLDTIAKLRISEKRL